MIHAAGGLTCALVAVGPAMATSMTVAQLVARHAAEASGTRVALVDLGQSTKIDGDIGEGGFDARVAAGSWFAAELFDCSAEVAEVVRKWSAARDLVSLRSEREAGRVLEHLGAPSLAGFFEVGYRLAADGRDARVTMAFYDLSGVGTAPALGAFEGYDVAGLSERLREAMTCGPEA